MAATDVDTATVVNYMVASPGWILGESLFDGEAGVAV